MIIRLEV